MGKKVLTFVCFCGIVYKKEVVYLLRYVAKEDSTERYKDVNSYHSTDIEPIKAFRPYPSIPNFKRNSYCENYYQCCHLVRDY
jgi:hypothetical protein